MALDITELQNSVSQLTDATEASISLLEQLGQEVRDAADDPEQVRALADQITAQAASLSEAVMRNTPADTTDEEPV